MLVSALRSRRGASFEIVRRLRLGQWRAVLSNHLLFEYEEVLKRQAPALGLAAEDVDEFLNAVAARSEECALAPGWKPVLSDPDDEPLVQLACESGVNMIVTHNVRDLAPAVELGVEVLKPSEFLARIREAESGG